MRHGMRTVPATMALAAAATVVGCSRVPVVGGARRFRIRVTGGRRMPGKISRSASEGGLRRFFTQLMQAIITPTRMALMTITEIMPRVIIVVAVTACPTVIAPVGELNAVMFVDNDKFKKERKCFGFSKKEFTGFVWEPQGHPAQRRSKCIGSEPCQAP